MLEMWISAFVCNRSYNSGVRICCFATIVTDCTSNQSPRRPAKPAGIQAAPLFMSVQLKSVECYRISVVDTVAYNAFLEASPCAQGLWQEKCLADRVQRPSIASVFDASNICIRKWTEWSNCIHIWDCISLLVLLVDFFISYDSPLCLPYSDRFTGLGEIAMGKMWHLWYSMLGFHWQTMFYRDCCDDRSMRRINGRKL